MLPNGDPTLIVRVLEAFMALQFQAGVLTEEMVLAVQGLVEVSTFRCRSWNVLCVCSIVFYKAYKAFDLRSVAVASTCEVSGRLGMSAGRCQQWWVFWGGSLC